MLPPYLKKSFVSAAAVIAPDGRICAHNPAFERLLATNVSAPDLSLFELIQSGSHGSLKRMFADVARNNDDSAGNQRIRRKARKTALAATTLFTHAGTAVQAEFSPLPDSGGDALLMALFVPLVQNSLVSQNAPTDHALQRDYLASIIAAIPDMLLIADMNGNIMEWGHADDGKQGFVPAAGFEESALQGLLPVRVRVAFRTALRQLAQGEGAHRVEYRLAGSGQDNWFEANLAPLGTDKVVILNRDITRRKETEEKLRLQEGLLRAIYESAGQSVTFIDEALQVVFFNQVAENFVKQVFKKQKKAGRSVLEYVLPGDVKEFEQHYKRALRGEPVYFEKETQRKWWRFYIYPVYDKAGKVTGIAQNVAEVTERKEREIELRENKERLNKTIEAIPHPLLIADDQLRITYVNEQFEKVLGFTEAQAVTLNLAALIPDARRETYASDVIRYFGQRSTGAYISGDRFISIRKADGQEITMSSSYNIFINFGKLYTIIILQDVSELKRRQDIILKQNQFLRKVAWQQSHGVRRPIANILAISNMIQTDDEMTQDELKQYLHHLSEEVANLDEIVKTIVAETNRIENTQQEQEQDKS